MSKLDEMLSDLDCLAAKARESGDDSLSAALLMLRNNRKPGTPIRAELERGRKTTGYIWCDKCGQVSHAPDCPERRE